MLTPYSLAAEVMHAHEKPEECERRLLEMRDRKVTELREDARAPGLPAVSFEVYNVAGPQRYVHEAGRDLSAEARLFCELHFASSPLALCMERMIEAAHARIKRQRQGINDDDDEGDF